MLHQVERFKLNNIQSIKHILVIGSPGSGKTTFSKELSKILGLPIHHLDDYYWLENWQRIDAKEWESTLHTLCATPTWIIDGNHFKSLNIRLPYTELVIFLDYPIRVCAWSFLIRAAQRYFGFDNDSLPIRIRNDPDHRSRISIQWHIAKLILFFKHSTKPKIKKLVAEHSVQFMSFTSRKQCQQFLAEQQQYIMNIKEHSPAV